LDFEEPFQYKDVIIDFNSKKPIRWEDGRNRICDPVYLKSSYEESESGSTFDEETIEDRLQHRYIEDEWEHFTVTFSIFFPGLTEKEVMRINGDSLNLGSWNKGDGPITMTKGDSRLWLTGERV
jgi:hypothetical protein